MSASVRAILDDPRLGERSADGRLRRRADVDPLRRDLPRAHQSARPLRRGGQGGKNGRLSRNLEGSRYVELPGADHLPWVEGDDILDEIQKFLTGVREPAEPDRVLATVLFTDVVGSTEKARELGDRRWRDLLDRHNEIVRRDLERFRGREVDTAGDGFFATFDGPARNPLRTLDRGGRAKRRRGVQSLKGIPGEWRLYAVA